MVSGTGKKEQREKRERERERLREREEREREELDKEGMRVLNPTRLSNCHFRQENIVTI